MAKDNASTSPYLSHDRLADVIAALQVTAASQRAEDTIAKWTKTLSYNEEPDQIARWTKVFSDHREFFLVYALKERPQEPKAVLRLRYINRNYDVLTEKVYSGAEREALDVEQRAKLTTKPLSPDQTKAPVDIAMELHGRAVADKADKRWWLPLLPALLASVAAIAGVYVGLHKSGTDGGGAVKIEVGPPSRG